MQYLTRVHCCGAHWIAHVPAIDRWTLVRDKRQIGSTARLMVADVTGAAADSFGLDLSPGRAVANVEEFSTGTWKLKRWPHGGRGSGETESRSASHGGPGGPPDAA